MRCPNFRARRLRRCARSGSPAFTPASGARGHDAGAPAARFLERPETQGRGLQRVLVGRAGGRAGAAVRTAAVVEGDAAVAAAAVAADGEDAVTADDVPVVGEGSGSPTDLEGLVMVVTK